MILYRCGGDIKYKKLYQQEVSNYNSLQSNYNSLQSNYNSLQSNYNSLQSNYNSLQSKYNNASVKFYTATYTQSEVKDIGFIPTNCVVYGAVRWHSTNSAGAFRINIYASKDNSNWVDVHRETDKSPGANKVGSYYYDVTVPSGYRYVKVQMDGGSGDWYLRTFKIIAAAIQK